MPAVKMPDQTVQRAKAIFASQHGGRDPLTRWPCPDPATNFLASCEWRLWERYKRCRLDYLSDDGGDPDRTGDTEWLLGFYVKLATSPEIKAVCGDRCRSRDAADGLLGLLFHKSDLMVSNCFDRPVFGALMQGHSQRANEKEFKEEQRNARADRRQFDVMKAAIGRLSPMYSPVKRAELHNLVEQYQGKVPQRAVPPPVPGLTRKPMSKELQVLFAKALATAPPSTASPRRGRPAFDNASEDTYLELVRRLVKKAYRGNDELEKAVAVVQHFSPGVLPVPYDANRLGSRLKPFLDKESPLKRGPGMWPFLNEDPPKTTTVREYLNALESGYLTHRALTSLLPPSRY